MKKQTFLLYFLLATTSLGTFAVTQSHSKLFKKSIEFGKAREIKTDISFFAGELNINTSTNQLAECLYGYSEGFLRPEMIYSESGKTGYLAIRSEEKDKGLDIDNDSNKWNLSINKDIKNDLAIKLKAGEANIDLKDCRLNSFEYKMTAGESNINLKNSSVPMIRVALLAGEANIDLSGKWLNDGFAEIKGGVGEVTVKVPFNTGVKVNISGVLGEVNIPFFHKIGNTYTNDSFEKTKYTLSLDISGGIGQINVIMEQ